VWLFDEEYAILEHNSLSAGLTKSDYIRNLIVYGSNDRVTNFSDSFAEIIVNELSKISNSMNQLSYQAKINSLVDENDFAALEVNFVVLLNAFDKIAEG
jgi:hypothetical protein